MINVLVLAAWILSGIVVAFADQPTDGQRWVSAPMAVFLGPLWLSVVLERRAVTVSL